MQAANSRQQARDRRYREEKKKKMKTGHVWTNLTVSGPVKFVTAILCVACAIFAFVKYGLPVIDTYYDPFRRVLLDHDTQAQSTQPIFQLPNLRQSSSAFWRAADAPGAASAFNNNPHLRVQKKTTNGILRVLKGSHAELDDIRQQSVDCGDIYNTPSVFESQIADVLSSLDKTTEMWQDFMWAVSHSDRREINAAEALMRTARDVRFCETTSTNSNSSIDYCKSVSTLDALVDDFDEKVMARMEKDDELRRISIKLGQQTSTAQQTVLGMKISAKCEKHRLRDTCWVGFPAFYRSERSRWAFCWLRFAPHTEYLEQMVDTASNISVILNYVLDFASAQEQFRYDRLLIRTNAPMRSETESHQRSGKGGDDIALLTIKAMEENLKSSINELRVYGPASQSGLEAAANLSIARKDRVAELFCQLCPKSSSCS